MFGLAQNSAICLRCLLRYELRKSTRLTHRDAAHLSQRWQSSSAASRVKVQEQAHDDQQEPHSQEPQDAPNYRFGISPTSWKRVNVHSDSVELGVNALGKPAQIRIVRDKPQRRDEKKKWRKKVTEKPKAFNEEDYATALAGVNAEASEETVIENIEQLRSIFTAKDRGEGFERAQCVAVAQRLVKGVSIEQLAAYVKARSLPPLTKDINDLERWFEGRLVTRSRYFSGASDFGTVASQRTTNPSWANLKGDVNIVAKRDQGQSKKQNYKLNVVERVLRQIWAVRAREEMHQGELDFRIHAPVHMELLMKHYDEIFTTRARQFNVRIEIDQPRCIVRLSGAYGQTLDVFDLIYKDLQNIKTHRIRISELHGDLAGSVADSAQGTLATEAYQKYIEDATDTRIVAKERTVNGVSVLDSLEVFYLGSKAAALDDVQQLVGHALEDYDPVRTQIQCDRLQGSVTPIEVPIEPGGVLPIRARYSNWKRWSFTPQFSEESEAFQSTAFKPRVLYRPALSRQLALTAREHLSEIWNYQSGVEVSASPYWQTVPAKQLMATIGYLVHRGDRKIGSRMMEVWRRTYQSRRTQQEQVERMFSTVINEPRRLATGVPDLAMKLEHLVSNTLPTYNELRVNLRPHKVLSHKLEEVCLMPDLQLIFRIDEAERRTRLESAQLVRDWRESDLMIPTQNTDIRFTSRALIRSPENNVDPALARFVGASHLDVWGSDRLQTPARMTLAVPQFACPKRQDPEGGGKGPNGHVKVEYLFKSLEHRSRMPSTYQGHRLYYSTVEAGRTGGRWDELTFEMDTTRLIDPVDRQTEAVDKQTFLDWFDSVRELNVRLLH